MRRLFTVGYLLETQHPLCYIIISFIIFLPREIVIDNKANENDRSILKAPKPLTEKSRHAKLIKIFFVEGSLCWSRGFKWKFWWIRRELQESWNGVKLRWKAFWGCFLAFKMLWAFKLLRAFESFQRKHLRAFVANSRAFVASVHGNNFWTCDLWITMTLHFV